MLLGAAPAPVNDPVADQAAHLAPRFPAPPAASAPLEPFDLSWQGGEGEVSTEPRFSGRLPEPEMAPAERGLVAKSQPPADSNEVSRAAESDRDVEPAGDPETDRDAESDRDAEPAAYVGSDGERIDASRLRVWLQGRDSPMAPFAEELVAAGIKHEVDPRLVVGIAVIESAAGKRLPPDCHNAWGWSGSGPLGLTAWPSWPASIDAFTEGLARVYDTGQVDETMARKYVPPNWERWLEVVRWAIDDI
jgi:hypothetical protein